MSLSDRVAQIYFQVLGSLSTAFYNLQDYGGVVATRLHMGVFVKIWMDIVIYLIGKMLISLHTIEVSRGDDSTHHTATGA
jgi:hypothetical protein